MILWVKDHIFPHGGNNHVPRIFHKKIVGYVLAGIMGVEVIFLVSALFLLPGSGFLASFAPEALMRLANIERQDREVPTLRVNSLLEQAAKLKAQDMAERGYFAHNTPEGKPPWIWLQKTGYKFIYAGENLAVNFIDAQDVNSAWMDSPTHRSNILNRHYQEIGIATAIGEYKGREAIFVVQFFGAPIVQTPSPVSSQEEKSSPFQEKEQVKEEPFIAVEEQEKIEEEPSVVVEDQKDTELKGVVVAVSEEASQEFVRGAVGMYTLSRPKGNTNMLFALIAILFGLVLLVKMLVRFHVVHDRPLLFRSMVVLGVIILFRAINEYISISGISIGLGS
ncbi:MAG: CAP domain-containing protein [bacterium]|nr:CAP domain-containing protein [bacterium]